MSSRRASSARTVDGPHGTSSCSAIHFEPTGWSSSTCAWTRRCRMKRWREESSTPTNLGGLELRLGVLDDLVVALGGLERHDGAALAAFALGAGDHDLLLRDAHPAELDRQAPQ